MSWHMNDPKRPSRFNAAELDPPLFKIKRDESTPEGWADEVPCGLPRGFVNDPRPWSHTYLHDDGYRVDVSLPSVWFSSDGWVQVTDEQWANLIERYGVIA